MRTLLVLILAIGSNIVAFFLADRWLHGFHASNNWQELFVAGIIFALLNWLLRPLLKLVLSPVILLTLGLGAILVNMFVLYILTLLTNSIIIDSTLTLLYATLLIGAVNAFISLFFHPLKRSK